MYRRFCVLLVLVVSCNDAPIFEDSHGGLKASGHSADLSTLTVTTFNVFGPGYQPADQADQCTTRCGPMCEWTCEDKFFDLVRAVSDSNSDIVVLNEVDVDTDRTGYNVAKRLAAALSSGSGPQWYWAFEQTCTHQSGLMGNALLSTRPITGVRSIQLDTQDVLASCGVELPWPEATPELPLTLACAAPVARGAIIGQTHGITVIGTHLDYQHQCRRDAELQRLLRFVDWTQPTVIAGDFNEGSTIVDRHFPSDQYSAPPNRYIDATANIDVTFPAKAVKIDHIILSGPLSAKRDSTGAPVAYTVDAGRASDHFAVSTVIERRWSRAISIDTTGRGAPSELLFYEPNGGRYDASGTGDFYGPRRGRAQTFRTMANGSLIAQHASDDWRSTWHTIVPGDFDGDGKRNDVLLYDRTHGRAEFHRVNPDGQLTLLRATTGWKKTWDTIIPVDLPSTRHTDLLFWDADGGSNGRGLGSLYLVHGTARWSFVRDFRYWRPSWDSIVSGDFDGDGHADDLFFYEQSGTASFHSLEQTVDDGVWLRTLSTNSQVPRGAEQIVAIDFSPSRHTDLLFYDHDGGEPGRARGDFYRVSGIASVSLARRRMTWRPGWNFIVSGDFNRDGRRNDLLFYDRTGGQWSLHTVSDTGTTNELRQ